MRAPTYITKITLGPVIGAVAHDEAIILTETQISTRIKVVLIDVFGGSRREFYVNTKGGHPATLRATGLTPATRYRVEYDEVANSSAHQGNFTTPSSPEETEDSPRTIIACGAPASLSITAPSARLDGRRRCFCRSFKYKCVHSQFTLAFKQTWTSNVKGTNTISENQANRNTIAELRSAYRAAWSTPSTRKTLSCCSNLMLCSNVSQSIENDGEAMLSSILRDVVSEYRGTVGQCVAPPYFKIVRRTPGRK